MKPANPKLIHFSNLCLESHHMRKLYTAHHLSFLLSFFFIVNNPSKSTAETLRFLPNTEHKIIFFINNILQDNNKSSEPVLKTGNTKGPHHGLIGHFARKDTVPQSSRIDSPVSWWPFLECRQALESGTVTVIDENLVGNYGDHQAAIVSKVKGIFVTGSMDASRHMVAMEVSFAGKGPLNDSLRIFGVYQRGIVESQISVVGGSGKYNDANGFAIVKSVGCERQGIEKKLLFNVYLKYEK